MTFELTDLHPTEGTGRAHQGCNPLFSLQPQVSDVLTPLFFSWNFPGVPGAPRPRAVPDGWVVAPVGTSAVADHRQKEDHICRDQPNPEPIEHGVAAEGAARGSPELRRYRSEPYRERGSTLPTSGPSWSDPSHDRSEPRPTPSALSNHRRPLARRYFSGWSSERFLVFSHARSASGSSSTRGTFAGIPRMR